ncbi:MAG: hypothetical protein ACREPT_09685 [Rudaea sp.]
MAFAAQALGDVPVMLFDIRVNAAGFAWPKCRAIVVTDSRRQTRRPSRRNWRCASGDTCLQAVGSLPSIMAVTLALRQSLPARRFYLAHSRAGTAMAHPRGSLTWMRLRAAAKFYTVDPGNGSKKREAA